MQSHYYIYGNLNISNKNCVDNGSQNTNVQQIIRKYGNAFYFKCDYYIVREER